MPKLNIFVLPNQTSILFGIIVTVLLGAIFAGSIGPSPVCIWPLALGFLLLPLRAFLAWPEREFRKHKLTVADDEFLDLTNVINEEAQAVGLPRVPKLAIGDGDVALHIFGSLRHWYIAISRREALCLQEDTTTERRAAAVRAMFIHELYHFKNGDYWQMGYARELLRTVAMFMLWAFTFLLGYGVFLLVVLPDILQFDYAYLVRWLERLPPEIGKLYLSILPSAEAWAEMQTKASGINLGYVLYFVANATLPFILIGSILWLFYWRKLLRTRELYADAGVAHIQGDISHFPYALLSGSLAKAEAASQTQVSLLYNVTRWIGGAHKQVQSALTPPAFINKWFSKHPEFGRRIAALKDPSMAYDHWLVTALLLGSLTLILDILLATPLTLLYYGRWPMHFSVLIISVIVTLALITPLVLGRPIWGLMFKVIGVIIALRFAWLTFTIGLMLFLLIFAPSLLSEILTSGVVATARYAGSLSGPVFDDLTAFVLEASLINMAQVFIVFASLVLVICGNVLLLKRLFTWYGFPQAKRRLLKIGYGIIAMTSLFVGLTILTPITIALLRPRDLLNPFGIMIGFSGFVMVLIGLALFLYADQKYARRCPSCGGIARGWYRLGRRCEVLTCKELLHPWLIAEYKS